MDSMLQNMFNPAFCGSGILKCIESYCDFGYNQFEYSLSFLILPLLMHKKSRSKISSTYLSFHTLVNQNEELFIKLPQRVREFIPITNQALLFLMLNEYIILNKSGAFVILNSKLNTSQIPKTYQFMLTLGSRLGELFKQTGPASTIFAAIGIRP